MHRVIQVIILMRQCKKCANVWGVGGGGGGTSFQRDKMTGSDKIYPLCW